MPQQYWKVVEKRGGEVYWFKDKPYKILHESKIKLNGIIDLLSSINSNKVWMERVLVEEHGEWIDVIIYQALYENPDGQIWVREKNEFYEKFKLKY